MVDGEFQWFILPQAIRVSETGENRLCDDPLCAKLVSFSVTIPPDSGVKTLCRHHAKEVIARATGRGCRNQELREMVQRTRETDTGAYYGVYPRTHLPETIDRDISSDIPEARYQTLCRGWKVEGKYLVAFPDLPTCKDCRRRLQMLFPRQTFGNS